MAADVWPHALLMAAFPPFANTASAIVCLHTTTKTRDLHQDRANAPSTGSNCRGVAGWCRVGCGTMYSLSTAAALHSLSEL